MEQRVKIRYVIIAAGLLATVLALYFGHATYRRHELTTSITALVADSGASLDTALAMAPEGAPADEDMRQTALDDAARLAAQRITILRALDTTPVLALAGDADDYLVTCREILRRVAEIHRYRHALSESERALRLRMRTDDRSAAWVAAAVQAKDRMQADFRNYRLAGEALAAILESYSLTRARMAAHVDPALLPEDRAVTAARNDILASLDARRTAVARAGRLDTYR
jgi:hypothetical protein